MPLPPLVSSYVERPVSLRKIPRNAFPGEIQPDSSAIDDLSSRNLPGPSTVPLHSPRPPVEKLDKSTCPVHSKLNLNLNDDNLNFVVKPTANILTNTMAEVTCPPGPWPDRLVMSPPHFGDLGKQARDVFGKGYHFGLLKLDIKTKTNTGVEFSTGGVSNRDTGKVFGSLESKYKFKDYGVTFTERWNTDNVLATDIALADFCDGAKVSLDTTFAPHTGDKSIKIKAEYRNDVCALNLDTDFKAGGPTLRGAAVVGYSGWLVGVLSGFDTSKSKLIDNKLCMGFVAKDFILNTSITEGRVFNGSIFHKVNPSLETGVQLSWSADNNDTDFGIGCKYNLDKDAALRFKVNNQSLIGLGYQQKLKEGVTVFLSAQIDGKNFNEGGHKIGFALELEA